MNRRGLLAAWGGLGLAAMSGRLDSLPSLNTVTPVEARVSAIGEDANCPSSGTELLGRKRGPVHRRAPDSPLEKPTDDDPLFIHEATYAALEGGYDEIYPGIHVCGDGVNEPDAYGWRGPPNRPRRVQQIHAGDELLVRLPSRDEASVWRGHEGKGKRAQSRR
ncbi:hypothetical protein ACNS7O_14210 [Haloferacaceae archaeon DSL9]